MGVGMWNHLCVYNPDLGGEETVEKQLVYTEGTADFVKLIGLAQGIAELAHAFGNEPAKWFETGGARPETVVVVPLRIHTGTSQDSNWRSGFWFAGQYSHSTDSLPPLAAYRSVQVAFSQHCLHWGTPCQSPEYWQAFGKSAGNWDTTLTSMVAPTAIRLAPGTFNPEIARSVDKLAKETGALDLIISLDGAAVYSGSNLDFTARREVQRWLARTDGATAARPNVDATTADTITDDTIKDDDTVNATDAGTNNMAGPATTTDTRDDSTDAANATDASINAANTSTNSETDDGTDTSSTATKATTNSASNMANTATATLGTWTRNVSKWSKYIPFGIPLGVPSLKSLPDPLHLAPWWSSEEPADVTDGVLAENIELFDGDRRIYATVWRQALFVYTAIFATPQTVNTITERLLAPVVTLMEGFSFAFAPPVRFYYLVLSPNDEITSTFPDVVEPDVLRTLLAGLPDEQQIIRLGSTWLYFSRLSNGAKVVFGKKNIAAQSSLLGALHSDVQQWIDDYERTHSIRK